MRCSQWKDWVWESLDRDLAPGEARRLRDHLAACPECAEAVRAHSALRAFWARAREMKAPARLNARIWGQIHGAGRPVPQVWKWLPLGLGLAAAAGFAVWLGSADFRESFQKDHFISMAKIPQENSGRIEQGRFFEGKQRVSQIQASRPAPKADVAESGLLGVASPKGTPGPGPKDEDVRIPVQQGSHPRAVFAGPEIESPERSLHVPPQAQPERRQAAAGFSDPTPVATASAPVVRLYRNKINLNLRETTRMEIRLDQPASLSAVIYTLEGKPVKRLLDGSLPPGIHVVEWEGSNDSGQKVSSGVYLLFFNFPNGEKHYKIAVIH